MNNTRRGFIAGLLAALAIGPAVAGPYNHIEVALRKYKNILDHIDDATMFTKTEYTYLNATAQGNALVDDLLNYMMTTFVMPTDSQAEFVECGRLFREGAQETAQELWNIPPTLLETIIPVAIMRDMMGFQKLSVNPSKMPSWDKFAEKYQDLILRS